VTASAQASVHLSGQEMALGTAKVSVPESALESVLELAQALAMGWAKA
jgi:hypothetical protein